MTTALRKLFRCKNGVAAIEFALILPLFVVLIIAMAEISRYAVIHQKLRSASHAMADYVTRNDSVTIATLNAYADAVDQIMQPFGFDGTVIFSAVASINPGNGGLGAGAGASGGAPSSGLGNAGGGLTPADRACARGCVIWQHRASGNKTSRIGGIGDRAVFPQGYHLRMQQNVVVSEVFYEYTPILPVTQFIITALAPKTNYSFAITKPRQGGLMSAPQ